MSTPKVEIAYATPEKQTLLAIDWQESMTAEQAILNSGVLEQHPEIDLAKNAIGIFSKRATLETLLRVGDRVEIYRPLTIDPMQKRRIRAKTSG